MAEKRVYLADVGPYIYENTDTLDDTEGIFTGRRQRALTTDDAILLIAGADIVLEGSDTDPGKIKFLVGTDTTQYILLGGKATGRNLNMYSDTSGTGSFTIGKNAAGSYSLLNNILMAVDANITLEAYDSTALGNVTQIEITNAGTRSTTYYISASVIRPSETKAIDLGSATYAWDDVYADDFQNVADFLSLDTIDDLAALEQIKGSGKIDPRTGLETIDDDTLPEFLKSKDKEGSKVLTDERGRPYISFRVLSSLLMGACRQLNKKISVLEAKLNATVKN